MTGEALLRVIADAPEDVTARLVYADWLCEFGDEGAWQMYLDLHPDHHEMRVRFGDWLAGRGDPRAEGYRALGVVRRHPVHGFPVTIDPDEETPATAWSWWGGRTGVDDDHWHLPPDWRHHLPNNGTAPYGGSWQESRREAEDAAALAFAKLPAARRAELLTLPGVPA